MHDDLPIDHLDPHRRTETPAAELRLRDVVVNGNGAICWVSNLAWSDGAVMVSLITCDGFEFTARIPADDRYTVLTPRPAVVAPDDHFGWPNILPARQAVAR